LGWIAEGKARGGVVEGGTPFFEEIPAEEAVGAMAELFAEIVEVGDEGGAGEEGGLSGTEGDVGGLITVFGGAGAEAVVRNGSAPESGVHFALVRDGSGERGAGKSGVEHEGEGAEVVVGEAEIEVVAGVVEGEDDGLLRFEGRGGERANQQKNGPHEQHDSMLRGPGIQKRFVQGRWAVFHPFPVEWRDQKGVGHLLPGTSGQKPLLPQAGVRRSKGVELLINRIGELQRSGGDVFLDVLR